MEKMGKGGGGGLCTKPLPVKHPATIQDGGIEAIYLAFCIPLRNNACTVGYVNTKTLFFVGTSTRC